MIVEYAPNGNLRDFLKTHRPPNSSYSMSGYERPIMSDLIVQMDDFKPLTQKDLISYAYQVARGMEYLASKHVSGLDLIIAFTLSLSASPWEFRSNYIYV